MDYECHLAVSEPTSLVDTRALKAAALKTEPIDIHGIGIESRYTVLIRRCWQNLQMNN